MSNWKRAIKALIVVSCAVVVFYIFMLTADVLAGWLETVRTYVP